MSELPFQIEYAKSGRAACKGCKEKIDQGTVRIAVMVQSAFHDGKQPNWHHEECFFKKQRCQSFSDIANFNKLKPADLKRIKEKIESVTGIVLPVEKGKGKKKRAAADNIALKDFTVEYSKSSRATCKRCDIKICKDEVRIAKTVYDTEVGMKYGGQPLWHHVTCFAEERYDLGFLAGGEDIPGFKKLKKEDQDLVKKEIPSKSVDELPTKKLKMEPKDKEEIKKEKDLEKNIEKQSKLFHKYRSALSQLSKQDFHTILEENSQEIPSGNDECLDRLADCMAFGKLEPCPECKGQLVLDTFNYKCVGDLSEWTKCQYKTQNPKRTPMIVPKDYKKGSVFGKYKPKVDVRAFLAAPPPPVIIKKDPEIKKDIPIPPLKNLQFFLHEKLPNKEAVKKRILKLGGLVVGKLTDTCAAAVSTKEDLEKMNATMTKIQDLDIEVVEESYLDLIDKDKGTVTESLELIKVNNITSWGNDPTQRVPQDVIDGKSIPKSGSMYVKSSKSGTTKLKIKGGSAVDPDSGVADEAHVYTDGRGSKHTVVLCKTDIVAQKNSYYKLQLLEADNCRKYWIFRSWGRIGTTIGGNKLEPCRSLDDAIDKFNHLYTEKTDNLFECRDNFVKVPGGYYPIDVDYGDDDAPVVLKADSSCSLPEPVQKLVVHIFDITLMKQTLKEFELDTEKMPLGKLSKKQIKNGYKVLSELLKHIQSGKSSQNKIIDASNRFYTLVPHDFGIENPPPLDNLEDIKKKTDMLDNLLEIEIAYSLLETESDGSVIPVEAHYRKLKSEIAPVTHDSDEYRMIAEYVANTHAATHSNYELEIEQVFKVVRAGEHKRYKPFKKLHNRRLLWHGSRTTNFAGILSQGLRIAPPEAPATGYMFGKGIYFADMVSKSANYCCTSRQNPLGVMLLCEVALGDMKECHQAEYITSLPAGVNSTWGVGRTQPDYTKAKTLDDGTIVPLAKPVPTDVKGTHLLYNEFIVYDVAQVQVKYLLQMKFNYMY